MSILRIRLRTLMIIVAVIAVDLGGIFYGSPLVFVACLFATAASPFIALLVYLVRKIGISTLFR